jgi:hypothetical protein
VTLSDSSAGATIYYTTNGTTPTTSSAVYSSAITVSTTETLEAIAVASGYTNSAVATAAYTITTQAATPMFSVAGGTYSTTQTVTISDSTSGATIYYTTNGTTPTTSSSVYSSAINVSSTETLEAIAVASGYTNSAVATAAYTITTLAPTFTITSTAPAQSVTEGSAATYILSVTPQNGAFTSPITFSVSGLPTRSNRDFQSCHGNSRSDRYKHHSNDYHSGNCALATPVRVAVRCAADYLGCPGSAVSAWQTTPAEDMAWPNAHGFVRCRYCSERVRSRLCIAWAWIDDL